MRSHPCRLLLLLPAVLLGLPPASSPAAEDAPVHAKKAPVPPYKFPAKGRHHFPTSLKNPEAQAWFDQGITLHHGFNHMEAARSFRKAASLEPDSPMPHWGLALTLGPNYNRDMDPIDAARNQEAHDAARRAVDLAAKAASPRERALAAALAQRYAPDLKADRAKLDAAYAQALKKVLADFPDDVEAAVLYADALMNLRPWKLWTLDGRPEPGTEEIVAVLEDVLRRAPEHPGANHLYIHAVEASPHPEKALPSAHRLETLVPWIGHLVHMPSHIYIHTGDHAQGALLNIKAAQADEKYLKAQPGEMGVYRMGYYPHNVHFLAFCRMAEGKYALARAAADKLHGLVADKVDHMPMLEAMALTPLQVDLRFGKWKEILKHPEPKAKHLLTRALRHYARVVALVRLGRARDAVADQVAFLALRKQFPEDAMWMTNPARAVLDLAAQILEARTTADPASSLVHWRKAVALQDALAYGEPPDWYYPVRESLGAALLRAGQAEEAEQVFRTDLRRHRRNPRSLFGLAESLRARMKTEAADLVAHQFRQVWREKNPPSLADY